MRCKHCNSRLAAHDIWCVNCRRQSSLVTGELSVIASLKKTWAGFKPFKSLNVPLAAPAIIFGLIPLAVIIWLQNTHLMLPTDTALKLILSLMINTIVFSIFVPFTMMGFNAVCSEPDYELGREKMWSSMKSYPRYLLFSLFNALYFVVIYLICFGVPGFGSDPILRLAWLVLVNYWAALILPVPVLMERRGLSVFSAFRLAYRHFHVVRWNLYLLALVLVIINFVAGIIFIIPLALTLPLSWYAVRDYTDLLLEYELDRQ